MTDLRLQPSKQMVERGARAMNKIVLQDAKRDTTIGTILAHACLTAALRLDDPETARLGTSRATYSASRGVTKAPALKGSARATTGCSCPCRVRGGWWWGLST